MFVGLCLNTSMALECYEKSPQFLKLDDKYFDLDRTIELSKKEKDAIDSFYSMLKGRWRGEISVSECEGPEEEPELVLKEGRVEAEISNQGNGVLEVKSDIDFRIDRSTSTRTKKTIGWERIYTLDSISRDRLVFSERYRQNAIGAGALFVENVFELIRQGRSLNFTQTIYYGGIYSIQEKWTLNKI